MTSFMRHSRLLPKMKRLDCCCTDPPPKRRAAVVHLNVGGKSFDTSHDTLARASYFLPYLEGQFIPFIITPPQPLCAHPSYPPPSLSKADWSIPLTSKDVYSSTEIQNSSLFFCSSCERPPLRRRATSEQTEKVFSRSVASLVLMQRGSAGTRGHPI